MSVGVLSYLCEPDSRSDVRILCVNQGVDRYAIDILVQNNS